MSPQPISGDELAPWRSRGTTFPDARSFRFEVSARARQLIHTQPGVATAEECAIARDIYDQHIALATNQHGSNRKQPILWQSCLVRADLDRELRFLAGLKARVLRAVTAAYPGDELHYTLTVLTCLRIGDHLVEHADNADYVCELHGNHAWSAGDCRQGTWIPMPGAWWRDVSVLLYLSDCSGGELYFPQYQLAIEPQAGLLVAFPSNRHFLHRVERVRSGARHAIAMWLTHDPDRVEE